MRDARDGGRDGRDMRDRRDATGAMGVAGASTGPLVFLLLTLVSALAAQSEEGGHGEQNGSGRFRYGAGQLEVVETQFLHRIRLDSGHPLIQAEFDALAGYALE